MSNVRQMPVRLTLVGGNVDGSNTSQFSTPDCVISDISGVETDETSILNCLESIKSTLKDKITIKTRYNLVADRTFGTFDEVVGFQALINQIVAMIGLGDQEMRIILDKMYFDIYDAFDCDDIPFVEMTISYSHFGVRLDYSISLDDECVLEQDFRYMQRSPNCPTTIYEVVSRGYLK